MSFAAWRFQPIKLQEMKIEAISVVAKLDDEKVYQVVVNETTHDAIISLIVAMEGSVSVLDKPLESIKLTRNE
jgi:hypothetical protein